MPHVPLQLGIRAHLGWLTFLSRYFRKGEEGSYCTLAFLPAETSFTRRCLWLTWLLGHSQCQG